MKNLQLITAGHPLTNKVVEAISPFFSSVDLAPKYIAYIENNLDVDKTICLDKDIRAKHTLRISKRYDLFGVKVHGYTNRPGHEKIEKQLDALPQGKYVLFDSDIYSGETVGFISKELKKRNIEISSSQSMIARKGEILDAEDFILDGGTGLVVKMPNGIEMRVPYVLPYVNCRDRCSVDDPIGFSLAIWAMNLAHFKLNPKLLGQLRGFVELFKMAGFTEESPMEVICAWHIRMLSIFKNGSKHTIPVSHN